MNGHYQIIDVLDTTGAEFVTYTIDLTNKDSSSLPRGIRRREIQSFKNEIEIAALSNSDDEAKQFCLGMVDGGYISRIIPDNNFFMILKNRVKSKFEVAAFLIGRFAADYAYIDVVCGTGGINLINAFANEANGRGYAFVELSSLANVLAYYPRHGFEHRKQCIGPPDIVIPGTLANQLKNDMKDMTGTKMDDYYRSDASTDLKDFIMDLHRRGYTSSEKPECQDPGIEWSQYYENDCQIDGFKMRKCFSAKGGTRRAYKYGGRKSRAKGTHKNRRGR
jgi:predicted N-acetyltransferase YhbS